MGRATRVPDLDEHERLAVTAFKVAFFALAAWGFAATAAWRGHEADSIGGAGAALMSLGCVALALLTLREGRG